jgi:glycosyltransferase involved in cell wall biosynthesis
MDQHESGTYQVLIRKDGKTNEIHVAISSDVHEIGNERFSPDAPLTTLKEFIGEQIALDYAFELNELADPSLTVSRRYNPAEGPAARQMRMRPAETRRSTTKYSANSMPAERTPEPAAQIEISIVMPCLNEAETLETCIHKAAGFLALSGVPGEIIIGDNGSTDGSIEIAERNGARVVNVPVRGYGAAIYHATLAARGRYVIVGDSDDSYDFSALGPFVDKLREGCDLVMGNRFLGGIRPRAMPWKNRYIGNPILSGIGRLLFRCPARDFHCGIRAFSLAAFRQMDLRTTGMEFASEMVIKSTLMGLRIAEVPTTLDPDGRSRPPHLRPWRDGWRHLRFMFLYSPRWLFVIPGLLMMLAGSLAVGALWRGDVVVGNIHLGVHTMLYAAIAVVAGYQTLTFGVFTKIFASTEGLLPEDKLLNKIFKYVTLESGLAVGFGLLVLSAAGSLSALFYWKSAAFGPLKPQTMLRLVIPAAFAFSLACQTILSSLFLSVLGLRVRRLLPGR